MVAAVAEAEVANIGPVDSEASRTTAREKIISHHQDTSGPYTKCGGVFYCVVFNEGMMLVILMAHQANPPRLL